MVRNLRNVGIAAFFLILAGFSQAQSGLNLFWQEVGPNNMGTLGRSIAFDGSGNVYVGALGGGLFKSSNLGATWVSVSGAENLPVSSISIDGSSIYVGTGEKYFYEPSASYMPSWDYKKFDTIKAGYHTIFGRPGAGVYVSTDGGATWSNNNATWSSGPTNFTGDFSSIQKVNAKGGRVLVATLKGMYWSDDHLATKTKSTGTTAFGNNPILDIEFANNNRVLAATADSIYISNDGGQTFGAGINNTTNFQRDPNYPAVGGLRIGIAVAPSNPDYIYVTGAFVTGKCSGVWKSTDNGNTWALVSPGETAGSTAFAPFGDFGKYAMVLGVSPVNPDYFFIGGNRLYSYTDTSGLILAASTTYIPGISTRYVPYPMMDMAFNPANSDQLFIIGDKEIVRSDDGGATYTMKTKGFNAANTYSVHAAPNYKIIAGERKQGLIYKGMADTSAALQQFYSLYTVSGHAEFSLVDIDHILGQGSDGGLVRSIGNGDSWEQFYGTPADSMHPSLGSDSIFVNKADSNSAAGNLYDSGNQPTTPWVMDEVFSPTDLTDDSLIAKVPTFVFMASRSFVWLVTNPFGGVDSLPKWTRVTTNLVSKSVVPREYLTAITVSGDANHIVYVASNYGKIYRVVNAHDPASMDVAANLAMISDSTLPKRWITSLKVDPNDRDNLVVTYASYDSSSSSHVYMTNNATSATVTWKSIGDNLPNIPVYAAAFHPDATVGALLIGTEQGVYSTTSDWNTLANLVWAEDNNNLGKVPVTDIFIRPYYKHIKTAGDDFSYAPDYMTFISTLGRGIFKSNGLVSRNENGNGPVQQSLVVMKVYPNPSSGVAFIEHTLSERSFVNVQVYDINGTLVRTLANQEFNPGTFILDFNAADLGAGIYFVRSQVRNSKGEFNKTMKSVVLK